MNFDQTNQSAQDRLDCDPSTIHYLRPDEVHPDEIVDGHAVFDEWVCNRPAVVEIEVSEPRPLPRQPRSADAEPHMGLKLTKRIRRKYVFEGTPGEVLKIPAVYRSALQVVRNGTIQGGLLPHARRVGQTDTVFVHPSLVEPTGPTAPSAPQAGTADQPVISSALAPADDSNAEERALKRARARRQA